MVDRRGSETTATARLIAERLRLFEDYLHCLEGADGNSINDWQRAAREARKSPRRSPERVAFRKRCRAAKLKWFRLRDLVIQNRQVIRLLEDPTLRFGGAVFHNFQQSHSGHFAPGDQHTVMTVVRKCWILGSECVEPAREGALLILDKLQKLAPLSELMAALRLPLSPSKRNRKLYNTDGSMKEGAYKILKALGKRRNKIEGIRAAAQFASAQSVRTFTGPMRKEGWIDRNRKQEWFRTKQGNDVFRAEK